MKRVVEIEQHAGFRLTSELNVWKQEQAAKPKLEEDPEYFTRWLLQHVELYRAATLQPERVLFTPIWQKAIREQFEFRYGLFSTLFGRYQEEGVESAMALYRNEIRGQLAHSVWATVEDEKIEGDPGRRNQKFDGGRYEATQMASLTPILTTHLAVIERNKKLIAQYGLLTSQLASLSTTLC